MLRTQQQVEVKENEIKDLKQDCRRPYDDTAEIRYLYEDKHRNKEILRNNGLPDIVAHTSH